MEILNNVVLPSQLQVYNMLTTFKTQNFGRGYTAPYYNKRTQLKLKILVVDILHPTTTKDPIKTQNFGCRYTAPYYNQKTQVTLW